ncbi:MAG: hypothetical protein JXB30_10840 [Anaerolineae bacterium]|nr:hypothetical protein [Anaerolineae bacterium]
MNVPLPSVDFIGGVLGFLFTIALLSYLLGDNPIYRLALHTFVGVAAGYIALIVIYQILTPRLVTPLLSGNINTMVLSIVPLVLFAFLIFKLSPRTAALGNISIACLVGVGTGVAVGGAITGTLLPQMRQTWIVGETIINAVLILAGTVTTLLYFQFWLRGATMGGNPERVAVMRVLADGGQAFLVIALGVIYGGMILSGIVIFSERLMAMVEWVGSFLPSILG